MESVCSPGFPGRGKAPCGSSRTRRRRRSPWTASSTTSQGSLTSPRTTAGVPRPTGVPRPAA
eukprot:8520799-Pyramimonas_sp.AAC.1